MTTNRIARFASDVGRVLGAWALLLLLEHFVIGVRFSSMFAGGWELGIARNFLSPIVLGALFPFALLLCGLSRMIRTPRTVALLGAVFGALVGYGVSFGRHFVTWGIRAPFILLIACLSAACAVVSVRALQRMSALRASVATATFSVLCWALDATVLPRLYPAFHLGLLALALVAAGVSMLIAMHRRGPSRPAVAFGSIGIIALLFVPAAAMRVRSADNLRLIMLDHAPLMGRAVLLAARIAPPPAIDTADVPRQATDPARSLDWSSRDIVLITIDALRADHVSAYGYSRPTTPNIDALARSGTRFEHAYCPTPHTSYSVTSLLTGKYMRPLLSLGVGEDSETWAGYLRHYGYRTAAFYPPAVFFIDEQKFRGFKERGLDFEYKKEEFADPTLRSQQVRTYIADVPRSLPLFLWVHVFEPHEPYVKHAEHPFGDPGKPTDIDAYDSEVAASDALVGEIVAEVKKTRPSSIFIVSADHGEEFGDHGGRYHGTTVYEEQVRVPLVIAGEGISVQTISQPVQTIDLLPTTLSALGIPKPPRIVGHDLGPILAGRETGGPGFAYAETDDYHLLAKGAERLVCQRKIGACSLFDVSRDPGEHHDTAAAQRDHVDALKRVMSATERSNGTFEKSTMLPEAIRRALARERDASADVAALMDDASPAIRRKAGEGVFRLATRFPEGAPPFPALAQVARACGHEEDPEAKRWCSLALVRLANVPPPASAERDTWLRDPRPPLADAAALTFGELGDAASIEPLLAAWKRGPHDLDESLELLRAMSAVRAKAFVPTLLAQLDDVRLRPFLFETLAEIGDGTVRPILLRTFAAERYLTSRGPEAKALLKLGAREELREALTRFAGMPEPFAEVVDIANRAGLLTPEHFGATAERGLVRNGERDSVTLVISSAGEYQVLVWGEGASSLAPAMEIGGRKVSLDLVRGSQYAGTATLQAGRQKIEISSGSGGKIGAIWLVPRVPELPPPAPKAWDAGTESSRGIEDAAKESP